MASYSQALAAACLQSICFDIIHDSRRSVQLVAVQSYISNTQQQPNMWNNVHLAT